VDAKNTCYGGRTHRMHLVSERITLRQNSCSAKLRHDPSGIQSKKDSGYLSDICIRFRRNSGTGGKYLISAL